MISGTGDQSGETSACSTGGQEPPAASRESFALAALKRVPAMIC
jgi:hypothetical protein